MSTNKASSQVVAASNRAVLDSIAPKNCEAIRSSLAAAAAAVAASNTRKAQIALLAALETLVNLHEGQIDGSGEGITPDDWDSARAAIAAASNRAVLDSIAPKNHEAIRYAQE